MVSVHSDFCKHFLPITKTTCLIFFKTCLGCFPISLGVLQLFIIPGLSTDVMDISHIVLFFFSFLYLFLIHWYYF